MHKHKIHTNKHKNGMAKEGSGNCGLKWAMVMARLGGHSWCIQEREFISISGIEISRCVDWSNQYLPDAVQHYIKFVFTVKLHPQKKTYK